jgi:hypothetical protein
VEVKNGTCKLHRSLNVDRVQMLKVLFILKYFLLEDKGFLITVTNRIIKQQTDLISGVKCSEQESKHVELL